MSEEKNPSEGDYVGGDKITVSGPVSGTGIAVGRDAHATVTQELSGVDLDKIFAPLMAAVQTAPLDKQAQAAQIAEDLKQEAAKGKNADDSRMGKLIDGLVGLVPEGVSAVVSAFASPILGGIAGPVTKFVLDKIQGK